MTCYDCGSPGQNVIEGELPERTRCPRCHKLKLEWLEERGMIEETQKPAVRVIEPSDPLARIAALLTRAREERQELRERVKQLKAEVEGLRAQLKSRELMPHPSQRMDEELEKLRAFRESVRTAFVAPPS